MGQKACLVFGAHAAVRSHGGSGKTRRNHIAEARRFAEVLAKKGFGVQKWRNISMRHVATVVHHWRTVDKLSVATIKEYLTAVRICCRFYGNDRVSNSTNADFGIENREYVTNHDKSLRQEVYDVAISTLLNGNENEQRIAAQMMLQRELGLRFEESTKFDPRRSVLHDGRVLVSSGTKGGRERVILHVSDKARAAIDFARSLVTSRGSLIPVDLREAQWRKIVYTTLARLGITRAGAGASMHGNRHHYAQARYQQITGFPPPCKFQDKEAFRTNAERMAGSAWLKLDQDARQIIKVELGHGPDRDSVVSQYLGSK